MLDGFNTLQDEAKDNFGFAKPQHMSQAYVSSRLSATVILARPKLNTCRERADASTAQKVKLPVSEGSAVGSASSPAGAKTSQVWAAVFFPIALCCGPFCILDELVFRCGLSILLLQ